ncbi:transcription initiation factor IID, TAF10 subunit [Cutaneotrichosporon oleaginosum]|uniref:Transcription initiation factor IID, TAF10 subunit n=1 Tax=Cutaneotrichosporon oleaginosum TaxID=879819 RepID=A0A0J0XZ66_9TREE|nr:transcription initiation factor IID, TAF10 subunit [Cutaneotrichosporon oleaginosum]KLT46336.1 transcription initiation factor IID, TAF10 subunit [Cutaneotrichosporon oleaginosum]
MSTTNVNGTPSASPAPLSQPSQPQPPSHPASSPAVAAPPPPSQPLPQTPNPNAIPNHSLQSNANANANASGSAISSAVQDKGKKEKDEDGPQADMFAARREEENARRDRSLAEFLVMLDGYKPLIPEEVTEYYLQRAGFECQDPRLKRLLSLSAQKFISDLSRDAFHFAKLRVSNTAAGRGRPSAGADRNRVVLTMDDLSLALGEHGVNVKKPDYYL